MSSTRNSIGTRITALLGLALALAVMTVGAETARAQARPICATHEAIETFLDTRFTEESIALGVASTGALIEVFTSGEGRTWTIVVTQVDGHSCILAAGTDWYDLRVIADGPGV